MRVAEEHAPRKRKRAVDASALTDDEEIGATVHHLPRRRVAARSTSRYTLNTPFTSGGRSHMRGDPINWSLLTQRMGTVRPPGRVSPGSHSSRTLSVLGARVARHVPPREETESVRQRNRTPFGASQLEGQKYSAPPCHYDQSAGQSRASYTNRPGGNDSLRMGGRRSVPMAGNHSLSPAWEYNHHTAMHRRVANDAHLTNPDGVIPAQGYYENFSAFQAQQDRVTRQPIHTAASNFNLDPVQGEVSTRYTSPSLLSTEECRNLWSGEEDVVWGNRNSTIPRYTDTEVVGSGLRGTNHLRPFHASQRTQPYVNSVPRPTITANRPRLPDQRPAPAPPNNPFFGYNDDDTATYEGSD